MYYTNNENRIVYLNSEFVIPPDSYTELSNPPIKVVTEGTEIDLTSTSDPNPINGETLSDDDYIVLNDQSVESENGLYIATMATDPSTWAKVDHPKFNGGGLSKISANRSFRWDENNSEPYLPVYIELSTDATDDSSPEDGIPDIPADGTSQATITIQKYSGLGNKLTGSNHDDELRIKSTRGKLSDLRINLTNGTASFTITSAPETIVTEISVFDPNGEIISDSIQIQFAP